MRKDEELSKCELLLLKEMQEIPRRFLVNFLIIFSWLMSIYKLGLSPLLLQISRNALSCCPLFSVEINAFIQMCGDSRTGYSSCDP
jgi:hypothetical protein